MSTLAEKIEAARRVEIKVGNSTFFCKRLTDEQFRKYAHEGVTGAEVCRRQVTDWANVKESDLIEGGEKKEIDFDKAAFCAVIGDKPDWWEVLEPAIIKDASDRFFQRDKSVKK